MSADRRAFYALVPRELCDWEEPMSAQEAAELDRVFAGAPVRSKGILARYLAPLWHLHHAVFKKADEDRHDGNWYPAVRTLILKTAETKIPYWDWTPEDWVRLLTPVVPVKSNVAASFMMLSYLVGGVPLHDALLGIEQRRKYRVFAAGIFGEDYVAFEQRVFDVIVGMGFTPHHAGEAWRNVIARLVLEVRGIDIRPEHSVYLQCMESNYRIVTPVNAVAAALHGMGLLDTAVLKERKYEKRERASEWDRDVETWFRRQTKLSPKTAKGNRTRMFALGDWFARELPHVKRLSDVGEQECEKFMNAVVEARYGTFGQSSPSVVKNLGKPFSVNGKIMYVSTMRRMLVDYVRMGLVPREHLLLLEFLEAPRSLTVQKSDAEVRDIDELVFAKLLTAALGLTPEDLHPTLGTYHYPFEMVSAVALTWLFSALRNDELRRLERDCLPERWSFETDDENGNAEVVFLKIPANKTSESYEKPVAVEVGEAIKAWQSLRPAMQMPLEDRKTRALTHYLFMVRNRKIGQTFVNGTIIPLLCRVAGVPTSDSRGEITSHRARSTMATLLANAKVPMSLASLQAWLGHKNPKSTQHYLRVKLRSMARHYRAAMPGMRIEVAGMVDLLGGDSEAGAARSARIVYSELGDEQGLCAQPAAHLCEHAMACPGCSLHVPESDPLVQRMRRNENAIRIKQLFTLTPEQARELRKRQRDEKLAEKLADVPTPDGRTPRQIRFGTDG